MRRLGALALLVLGCGGLTGEPGEMPATGPARPSEAVPAVPSDGPTVPPISGSTGLSRTVLVTGFGPFLDVTDNPSGRLAASVDGAEIGGWTVVGKVLEVSYAGAPARTIAAANAHRAGLVIGIGVDTDRDGVFVERCGYAGGDGATRDVDDVTRPPAEGRVEASLDVDLLARALGATISEEPGRYVCNGWLYDVRRGLPDRPVGFVHLPAAGISKERFLSALDELVRSL